MLPGGPICVTVAPNTAGAGKQVWMRIVCGMGEVGWVVQGWEGVTLDGIKALQDPSPLSLVSG